MTQSERIRVIPADSYGAESADEARQAAGSSTYDASTREGDPMDRDAGLRDEE